MIPNRQDSCYERLRNSRGARRRVLVAKVVSGTSTPIRVKPYGQEEGVTSVQHAVKPFIEPGQANDSERDGYPERNVAQDFRHALLAVLNLVGGFHSYGSSIASGCVPVSAS